MCNFRLLCVFLFGRRKRKKKEEAEEEEEEEDHHHHLRMISYDARFMCLRRDQSSLVV